MSDPTIEEERHDCIQMCISTTCYDAVYTKSPLEDGEIDVIRGRDFEKCVKDEIRQEKKRQREEARMEKRKHYNVKR
jgi:Domain of unknown function (DUF4787)